MSTQTDQAVRSDRVDRATQTASVQASTTEERGTRQWSSTERTRRAILDAARDVFVAEGYANANISHIVERSGLSVGSLYHHFNGKADLFVALWTEFEAVYSAAAAAAVAEARHRGETDPVTLFVAGSGAYLDVARNNPQLTLLFRGGGGPPEYNTLGAGVSAEWMRNNMTLLGLSDCPRNRLRVRILTTVVVEGERAIASVGDSVEVEGMIAEVLAAIQRIASVD